ncbi:MAG: 3-phosphoserine/phosphohydroxythreonine transaminase [Planctomycetota bacterium]|jgi:phosphoserine aminotransferase
MSGPLQLLNFGAGPALLPPEVREAIAADIADLGGHGIGLLETGHRSPAFDDVMEAAEDACRRLAGLGPEHAVLFLPGGATMQFAMVPMNLLPPGGTADHLHTGIWTGKAMREAARFGRVHRAFDGGPDGFRRIPDPRECTGSPDAAYLHYCANNTVMGTQFPEPPVGDAPLVVDASSEIFSRDPRIDRHRLIYAGAQKNLGPAGVSLVLVDRDWLASAAVTPEVRDLPSMLDLRRHLEAGSRLNTPPTFGIQLMRRMFEWILSEGGLPEMAARSRRRAAILHAAIDESGGFYRGHAEPGSRSLMNVVFRTPNPELDHRFVLEAEAAGMVGLRGHREVGGLRASIYNAFPESGCRRLAAFMGEFLARHG